ncbi:MAG: glycosyltransferase, partial [Bacteroidota bacterium]|nr:glycosyltransferase [Bacteroidota bacterium]
MALSNQLNKIVIVCSRLDLPGGTERASVNLANLFASKGHKVTIIVLDKIAAIFYPIDKNIGVIKENLHFGIGTGGNMVTRKLQFLRHIFRLRKILKAVRPDYIISTEYSLTIPGFFATTGFTSKIIAWEHHHFYWIRKNKFWSLLFRYVYPKLQMVVTQNSVEKSLFEKLGCIVSVIPNVVPQQKRLAALTSKMILSVGWLIKRKGIDLLPAVAEKVFANYPDWKWKIIGGGEELLPFTTEI